MKKKKTTKKLKQRLGPAPAAILRGGVHTDKRQYPRGEAERRAIGEDQELRSAGDRPIPDEE